jgi:iron-sulfur cluster insertion protein
MSTESLFLTPLAAQHILAQKGCLRVQVKVGGCSGFRYIFTIEEQPQSSDIVFTEHQACVITDPLSLHFIAGSTIDYRQELLSSHFMITNPKATNGCGCGDSFTI